LTKPTTEGAYVTGSELYLDPTILEKSAIERMPDPTGWRMLVFPFKGRKTSDGGIHLLQETVNREALATVVALVVKMGPLCYADTEKFGDTPWCKEMQWVLIGRYSGARFKLEDGEEVRIINDDEVIGTILKPDDIVSFT
tara:strand:+ start:2359 stop:2778 length:420 start_codon:yes stop_codon:yes gene_type:complete